MNMLTILYQDDGLVAVDKPAGILVHQARTPEPKEQIAMKILRDQLDQKIFTIHRLDRPTSGVLLFATSEESLRLAHDLFENREVTKKYIAIVHGQTPLNWQADTPLRRIETEEPRSALTDFKRLHYRAPGSFQNAPELEISIVEATPHTGRYHQIRQHLQLAGHPILGDYLYGDIEHNNLVAEQTGIQRMMLMSNELHFTHPKTGVPVEIKAPIPPEFSYFTCDRSNDGETTLGNGSREE
jgi:tRNA pseudouridine65 synthase